MAFSKDSSSTAPVVGSVVVGVVVAGAVVVEVAGAGAAVAFSSVPVAVVSFVAVALSCSVVAVAVVLVGSVAAVFADAVKVPAPIAVVKTAAKLMVIHFLFEYGKFTRFHSFSFVLMVKPFTT